MALIRKEVKLRPETVKALEKGAAKEGRSLKNYMEQTLIAKAKAIIKAEN